MPDLTTFRGFIDRIRAGDEQAALTLVREYEPFIRREVRLHLQDRRLCSLFDSMDELGWRGLHCGDCFTAVFQTLTQSCARMRRYNMGAPQAARLDDK